MDCVSKVQLHVSCEGLLDKDVLSKSDPICAVYIFDALSNQWREVNTRVKWVFLEGITAPIKTKVFS